MTVEKQTLEMLSAAGVPAVSQTLFGLGIMNAFIPGLSPASPDTCRFAGPACTLRAIPMREDIRVAIAEGRLPNPHRQALAGVKAGEVIVTDIGDIPRISLFGDLIGTHLANRGVAGIVTDGGVADLAALAAVPLPVFSAGSAPVPASGRVVVVDIRQPISCRGVPVYDGDIVVGDPAGAVVVPAHLADTVAEKALEKERLEAFLLERLQAGAPLEGTYPPNAETLAAYRARG
ncbi:RraA family protein [Alsobacter sp. R-9]